MLWFSSPITGVSLTFFFLYWCWSKLLAEQIIIELQSGSARELKILPKNTNNRPRKSVGEILFALMK